MSDIEARRAARRTTGTIPAGRPATASRLRSVPADGSLPPPARTTVPSRIARALVLGALDQAPGGKITVLEGGNRREIGGRGRDQYGQPDLEVTIRAHDARGYQAILRSGSVGLGESYAAGWWDVDDLTTLLRIITRTLRRFDPWRQGIRRVTAPVTDPVRRLRLPSHDRDRRNIHAHYDLGNDFFERLLDDTMLYSCAVFPSPSASLAEASAHKVDLLCRRAGLGPDDHVLEIGTGWGGFAVQAARQYGCRVTTTTISAEQYRLARQRVDDEGLGGRVTVLDADYRDIAGRFDAIVSIEMIEAIDWRQYEEFFAACGRLLSPQGRLAMQAIVIPSRRFDQARTRKDFIKRVIFPGGCLPSIEALLHAAGRVGDLDLVDLEDIGSHYGETLRRWRSNLADHAGELEELGLDETFRRTWEFYLSYCEAGFEERYVGDVQLVMARPGWTRPPRFRPL